MCLFFFFLVKISPMFHDIDLNFQICQGYGCHSFQFGALGLPELTKTCVLPRILGSCLQSVQKHRLFCQVLLAFQVKDILLLGILWLGKFQIVVLSYPSGEKLLNNDDDDDVVTMMMKNHRLVYYFLEFVKRHKVSSSSGFTGDISANAACLESTTLQPLLDQNMVVICCRALCHRAVSDRK